MTSGYDVSVYAVYLYRQQSPLEPLETDKAPASFGFGQRQVREKPNSSILLK